MALAQFSFQAVCYGGHPITVNENPIFIAVLQLMACFWNKTTIKKLNSPIKQAQPLVFTTARKRHRYSRIVTGLIFWVQSS